MLEPPRAFAGGAVIKKRWKSLRDAYRKALLKKKTKSGQANKNIKPWKYEEQMSFLNEHLADKRLQVSNLGYGDDKETGAGDNDTEKTTEHLSDDSQTEPSTPPHPPPMKHAASFRVVQKKRAGNKE
ncbi:hypothetical protein J6590_052733 [Homalodisca vitripennis]|nr:hypothetical protein J6590_052733 [Homalodisca vitripennis]